MTSDDRTQSAKSCPAKPLIGLGEPKKQMVLDYAVRFFGTPQKHRFWYPVAKELHSDRAHTMTNDSGNPYETPTATSGSSIATPHREVYRYTELPRTCPSCERRFSDTFYHRLYPRRYRLGTIVFFVILAIGGFVLTQFIGLLALFTIIPLFAWAMIWHKKVRVRCTSCGWGQTFIVSVRG